MIEKTENSNNWYNRFQAFAVGRMVSPSLLEEDDLIYWRVRILFSLLFAAALLTILTVIPVTILVIKENAWGLGLFDAATWAIVVILLFARNIGFEIRVSITLALTYLLGVIIIFHVGFLSGGAVCLFGFAVLTAIFKKTKSVTMALLINAITLSVLAWLFSTGRLDLKFPFFKTTEAMLASGTTFMLINSVVAVSARILVRGLAITNQKQKELVKDLKNEQARLESTKTMLENEIKDHKRAEDALRESEERWKFALEGSRDGVWDWDAVTNRVYFSDQWKAMLGYESHEIGSTLDEWESRVHPDDKAAAYADLERHFRCETETYQNEHRLRCKDGSYKWILDRGKVIEWTDEGKPRRVIGTHTDISDRKRYEDEKKLIEAQSRQLHKTESLGRMAGAIAHHFNNQLSVVMGNLELAVMGLAMGKKTDGYLNDAMQSARKASKISALMLTYLGQTPVKKETLDLSETFRRSIPMIREAVPKEVFLNAILPPSGPMVNADSNQVQQVITNLVTNAWEAVGNADGTINIGLKTVSSDDIPVLQTFPIEWKPQDKAYACIEVADNGSGIAENDFEKIFDPFFSSKFTGRGLGLAIVLGIVKSHGGAINVGGEPGRGAVFRVYFPLLKEKASRKDEVPDIPIPPASGLGILLVEDEDAVRKMAGSMLELMGYNVFEAKDGLEAVEVFRLNGEKIRCIICDLTMPGIDGWETLASLRKLNRDIPVILASGYDRERVMAGYHPEMPQVFLNKPYEFKELENAVRCAMSTNS